MSASQRPTVLCFHCGRQAPVVATPDPYRFDVTCACGQMWTICWATKDAPPTYVTPQKHQPELFT